MRNNRFSTVFGALVMLAAPLAMPANAAEEIAAKLQLCAACHGANGEPINATTPIIWGQQEYFLVKQLHHYKVRDRESPIMMPMAQTLTQQDLRPVAAYFASKPWPARPTSGTPAAAATPA